MMLSILKYILKKLVTTKSLIIRFENKDYLIENNTDPLIILINNHKFLKKIFYAPSLVLAEGYMVDRQKLNQTSWMFF